MPKRGILLVNLGSPASTTISDVRRYLGEFLMDPYVIDSPWLIRKIARRMLSLSMIFVIEVTLIYSFSKSICLVTPARLGAKPRAWRRVVLQPPPPCDILTIQP